MSFYSYKNSGSTRCPCSITPNNALSGLCEKVCIQVQRVYDSCLQLEYGFSRNPIRSNHCSKERQDAHIWRRSSTHAESVW